MKPIAMQMAMFERGADGRVGARLTGYEPKEYPESEWGEFKAEARIAKG